jgi:7,8-dihydropterin-6-yl-methyl-4-(beta-D-ribofuranosyl)aminobenzene 5'-phosphate synthase
MKLTILVDNNTITDRYFLAEPGFSAFIEDGPTRVLFDLGYSGIFATNADKLGIPLLKTDYVVLSHGHLDHTWGLVPFVRRYTEAQIEGYPHSEPVIVAHPGALHSRSVSPLKEIGSIIDESALSRIFHLNLTKGPLWLTDNLVFLGEIKRRFKFEGMPLKGHIKIKNGRELMDSLSDDTAIVYTGKEGLVIITGCSHSGICNICEQATDICGDERIRDIIGGLHMINPSREQIRGTIDYMMRKKPAALHPCHCTDLGSKIALASAVPVYEVGVGLVLEYM